MFSKLLLIFIGIPFLEMMILIKMGEMFGFWSALMLIVMTGFLGALLAKIQGMRAWNSIQYELHQGNMPGEQMIDALLIFIAGILLMTPGLLTDIAGFLLLIPASRYLFKRWLRKKFEEMLRNSREGGPPPASFHYFIR